MDASLSGGQVLGLRGLVRRLVLHAIRSVHIQLLRHLQGRAPKDGGLDLARPRAATRHRSRRRLLLRTRWLLALAARGGGSRRRWRGNVSRIIIIALLIVTPPLPCATALPLLSLISHRLGYTLDLPPGHRLLRGDPCLVQLGAVEPRLDDLIDGRMMFLWHACKAERDSNKHERQRSTRYVRIVQSFGLAGDRVSGQAVARRRECGHGRCQGDVRHPQLGHSFRDVTAAEVSARFCAKN